MFGFRFNFLYFCGVIPPDVELLPWQRWRSPSISSLRIDTCFGAIVTLPRDADDADDDVITLPSNEGSCDHGSDMSPEQQSALQLNTLSQKMAPTYSAISKAIIYSFWAMSQTYSGVEQTYKARSVRTHLLSGKDIHLLYLKANAHGFTAVLEMGAPNQKVWPYAPLAPIPGYATANIPL